MALFKSAIVTDAGAALVAEVMGRSKQIEFTTMTVGDGTYTEEEKTEAALRGRTDMKNTRLSVSFSSIGRSGDTAVRLAAVVSNATVESGFYITEVGIWAKDGSVAGSTPVLYSIVLAEVPDYLPEYNGSIPSTIQQAWYTQLSNDAIATIEANPSAYALASDFQQGTWSPTIYDDYVEMTVQANVAIEVARYVRVFNICFIELIFKQNQYDPQGTKVAGFSLPFQGAADVNPSYPYSNTDEIKVRKGYNSYTSIAGYIHSGRRGFFMFDSSKTMENPADKIIARGFYFIKEES